MLVKTFTNHDVKMWKNTALWILHFSEGTYLETARTMISAPSIVIQVYAGKAHNY